MRTGTLASKFHRLGVFEANALVFLARQRGGRWSKVRAKHPTHEAFVQRAIGRLWRLGLIEESGGFIKLTAAGKELARG